MINEIKNIKGNLLLIGNNENIIEEINKNKKIGESYILSNIQTKGNSKKNLKLENKKIHINKIKRYFNKKSIDNIIVDYKLIEEYIDKFVKNSVYLNKGYLYFYNVNKNNEIEKKYKRYNTKIEKNNNYIKINNINSKNNIIKDNYFILKDKKDKFLDKLSDLITS